MIVSNQQEANYEDFLKLIQKADRMLKEEARENSQYYLNRDADDFEEDVYRAFKTSSIKTPFEGSVELVSGHRFPDIVINNIYGVEVKTTKQDHWTSTGNSIFESTRIDNVKNIFMYFAKLTEPVEFKYRKYEECLSAIAVTHSPRYLIDMELPKGDSIFDKIGIEYEKLREMENPIKPFIDYIRKNTKKGEEPWWMGSDEIQVINPTVRLFTNLSKDEKKKIVIEALALFPEIFGNNNTKYYRVTTWLAARYGIVNPSMRDSFTAGGVVDISIGRNNYYHIPRVFKNLYDNIREVINLLDNWPREDLSYYLHELKKDQRPLDKWVEDFLKSGTKSIPDNRRFLVNLISYYYPKPKPQYLLEEEMRYGI
jgi:hypothetical protein